MGSALVMNAVENSDYVSSVAIGVGKMGHAGEEYIVQRGNGLEGFGTKGRIDRNGWRFKADSLGRLSLLPTVRYIKAAGGGARTTRIQNGVASLRTE